MSKVFINDPSIFWAPKSVFCIKRPSFLVYLEYMILSLLFKSNKAYTLFI